LLSVYQTLLAVPRADPKPSLSPVTQSLAAPGAPGASPFRAEAMAGETTIPKAKARAATDPTVTAFQTRAGIFGTSANPRNYAGQYYPTTRTSSPFHIEAGFTRPESTGLLESRHWRTDIGASTRIELSLGLPHRGW
jgi:hypothetical protein